MNARKPDAIVIGAGIVGSACAAALARDGRRVLVLDRSSPAAGTTAAGMGHLVVMDDSPEQLALTSYSVRLWRARAKGMHRKSEFDGCGTLWIAENAEQWSALETKRRAYAACGVAAELVDGSGVARLEPNLRAKLAGALRVEDDAVVYPPGAALELLEDARANGATVRDHCNVLSVAPHEVSLSDERVRADVVVIATGAWAPQLLPDLPIVPRKGHLVITDRHPGFCHHQLVELGYLASAHEMSAESVAFNVQPRATGQILIGSSRELVGWDASINRDILGRMLQRASAFMPSLGSLSAIRTWTGFRPTTSDKLPLIGRWEPIPGLWVAAGHEGLGISTSLATADLLADLIAERRPAIDAAPFTPMRALEHAT